MMCVYVCVLGRCDVCVCVCVGGGLMTQLRTQRSRVDLLREIPF